MYELTDEDFGEILKDQIKIILKAYPQGQLSGRRLLAMLEGVLSEAQPIAAAMDMQDADALLQ